MNVVGAHSRLLQTIYVINSSAMYFEQSTFTVIKTQIYNFLLLPGEIFFLLLTWSCGVEVITSALHAEGPQFDPGRDQLVLYH